jgi:hypothetical protein
MALNTDKSVVAVEAGEGLEVDEPATFGGTVTLQIDASQVGGELFSEDANGNLQLNLGAFLQDDGSGNLEVEVGRGLQDDGLSRVEVKFADNEILEFGTDSDVGISYSNSSDTLILKNLESSSDEIEFDQESGSVNMTGSITEGATL